MPPGLASAQGPALSPTNPGQAAPKTPPTRTPMGGQSLALVLLHAGARGEAR